MPNTLSKVTFNFVDAKGFYAHVRLIVSEDTAAHAVSLTFDTSAAIQAISNAEYNGGTGGEQLLQVPGVLGTQATYGSIEDKAQLTYVASSGSLMRIQIPAPKASIFLADGETVDATNTDVAALNELILNAADNVYFWATRSGNQFSTFAGGRRIRRKNQRRVNIFTRNPQETGPAE